MIYFFLVLAGLTVMDLIQMITKKQKREIAVYLAFMLLVGLFGIFYYSDPERTSFTGLLFSFIGLGE